jgi:hypothetical protein
VEPVADPDRAVRKAVNLGQFNARAVELTPYKATAVGTEIDGEVGGRVVGASHGIVRAFH